MKTKSQLKTQKQRRRNETSYKESLILEILRNTRKQKYYTRKELEEKSVSTLEEIAWLVMHIS